MSMNVFNTNTKPASCTKASLCVAFEVRHAYILSFHAVYILIRCICTRTYSLDWTLHGHTFAKCATLVYIDLPQSVLFYTIPACEKKLNIKESQKHSRHMEYSRCCKKYNAVRSRVNKSAYKFWRWLTVLHEELLILWNRNMHDSIVSLVYCFPDIKRFTLDMNAFFPLLILFSCLLLFTKQK